MPITLLALALTLVWPSFDENAASEHARAAYAAAREFELAPELLLAMAFIENAYTSESVSQVRGAKLCGPLQVRADSVEHCTRMQTDLAFGYREGARVLKTWAKYAHGDMRAATRGFGCGWQLDAATGKPAIPARPADHCNAYDVRAFAIKARIEHALRVSLAS